MMLFVLLLLLTLVVAAAGVIVVVAVLALDALSCAARALGLDWGTDEVIMAVIGVALVVFFVWFVTCMGPMDYMSGPGTVDHYEQPHQMRD